MFLTTVFKNERGRKKKKSESKKNYPHNRERALSTTSHKARVSVREKELSATVDSVCFCSEKRQKSIFPLFLDSVVIERLSFVCAFVVENLFLL